MMSKRLLAVAVLVALFSLAGSAALAADKPNYGGTIRWAETTNPPKLDPHFATDTSSARAYICMFDTLVASSPDGKTVEPWLAESWTVSKDGRVYRFKLRKGVTFHKETEGGKATANKGREVTAVDWKWSFERMVKDKSPRAYFVDMIDGYDEIAGGKAKEWRGIKVIDKYTLQITLKQPFAPFIPVLAYQAFSVLPMEDVVKHGKNFNFHPVGTGPFYLESWKHDQRLVFKRNPNYWRKDKAGNQLPFVDRVEIVILPERTIAWEEFKKGSINMLETIPPQSYAEARKLLGGHFIMQPLPNITYFGFNMRKKPFAGNLKLRQAINYAIDRQRICDLVLEGAATPALGVLPPSMPGYNKNLKGYTYNPKKAKKLLAEAGYPKGLGITIQVNNGGSNKQIAEAVQAQLGEVGIKLDVRLIDWGVHLDMLDRGECDMYRMSWVVDYLDPDNFLYVNLHSGNFGSKGNYSFYKNHEVDSLLEKARNSMNQKERISLYQKAEQMIVDDAPWLFLTHGNANLATAKELGGVRLHAFGAYATRLEEIFFTKKK